MKALNSILPYLPLGRLHEVDELVGKPPGRKEGDVAAEASSHDGQGDDDEQSWSRSRDK